MRLLKKIVSFMFSRLFLVALMLFVQIAMLCTLIVYFSQSVIYVYLMLNLLSFAAVIVVVSNNENPSYKLTWIITILVFPPIGCVFYFLFGNSRMPKKLEKRIDYALEDTLRHMPSDAALYENLNISDTNHAIQSRYIYNVSGYPLNENTSSEYYTVGELMFDGIVRELEKAEKFIFLEFFIIQPGVMWDAIFAILKRKIEDGVEVRMIYDDLGSIQTLPKGYDKIIRAAGIRLCVFNPFRPRVSMIMNHRDHRKIIIVDGKAAFCGGINLADEYINQYERYGHWKDTGVLLRGDAVWPFTFMFLQMWQFSTDEFIDFGKYRAESCAELSDGLVQPFGDSPLDEFNVMETAYLNIISRAKEYVYITTPYLVIDNEMECALCTAAQAGIDVRIITPYIYDKWYVHLLTRSHYSRLIKSGVKIYEYKPGFMHAKMFVSDDKVAMVGTCNMDFRSFYLHFECSVAFYGSKLIGDVKKDMLECQELSNEIALQETKEVPVHVRLLRAFLKIFAPLM